MTVVNFRPETSCLQFQAPPENHLKYLQSCLWSKKTKANYAAQVELQPGASYEYRYCFENKYWFNDVAADKYVASPYSDAENCVLDLEHINV